MNVPLLDLGVHHDPIRDEILAALERTCASERYILGPEVAAFEAEIAEYTGVRFGIGVSSGSDALLATLMALDVGPGDEVVTSTYTFFATAGAVSRLGAMPVFVDIEPNSFNLDPAAAVSAITDRTKAVIPVHLFGRCADMDPILEACSARDIPVIEDAAQALGGRTPDGRMIGTMGDATCHSFFPSKNLGCLGDGGMVVSDDEALADGVRLMRGHGARPKYYHKVVGGNFRLDAIQAAVLRVKMPRLGAALAGRAAAADRYRGMFGEIDLPIELPEHVEGHSYNQFVIRAPDRDGLQRHLTDAGIGTAIYYPLPLHVQECFSDCGMGPGDLPQSERAADETLAIPIFPEIEEAQQAAVVEACRRFYD